MVRVNLVRHPKWVRLVDDPTRRFVYLQLRAGPSFRGFSIIGPLFNASVLGGILQDICDIC